MILGKYDRGYPIALRSTGDYAGQKSVEKIRNTEYKKTRAAPFSCVVNQVQQTKFKLS
jgi:hypothetical protein